MTDLTTTRGRLPLFAIASAVIAIVCVAITRSQLFAANPDVVAWGVTLDLTLTIPLLYYLFVIRSGAARPITIVPVFVIGALIAAIALPRGHQQLLHELRFVVAPLEIVTIVLLVRKLRRGAPTDNLILGVVATEIAVIRHAFAWHRRADIPEKARAFTMHTRSGWGAVVFAFAIVIGGEAAAAHLLLQMWSVRAAWVLTSLDIYGILWLIGDWNALRLRPPFVADDVLHIRYGLRWSVTVPIDDIVACDAIRDEADWKNPRVLKVALLDSPRFLLRFRSPVVAHGLLGLRKTIDAVAIAPDDDDALLASVRRGSAPEAAAREARP